MKIQPSGLDGISCLYPTNSNIPPLKNNIVYKMSYIGLG